MTNHNYEDLSDLKTEAPSICDLVDGMLFGDEESDSAAHSLIRLIQNLVPSNADNHHLAEAATERAYTKTKDFRRHFNCFIKDEK